MSDNTTDTCVRWEPLKHNDPYFDDSPVWLDEHGAVCWQGAFGRHTLILHGDMKLCIPVAIPAAPLIPSDVAATIEAALQYQLDIERNVSDNYSWRLSQLYVALAWLAALARGE